MKMRRLLFSLGLMSVVSGLFGQQTEVVNLSSDEAVLKSLPRLTTPPDYATRPLPAKKDNSKILYFSGVYSQTGWSCNQAGSIWTMFTYEMNYLRGLSSSLPENQYNPMAIFNLLNNRNNYQGVTYFDSWKLIKANGIPGNADYPVTNLSQKTWMTGYDKYYRGMKNTVDQVYAIDVGSPEGLLTLKHWLNDHLDGSQIGGLANYQIGSGANWQIREIPMGQGLEEEGQHIVTRYDPAVGHCQTFIGWNDSVRYDVNEDGQYTNNIDIDGDGVVTMKDWEIGAMLVLNSWGPGWQDGGKVWVMYRLLAEPSDNGGIWNNAAMVVKPKKTYNPLLTVKTKIRYNLRDRIKIQVGVSSDLNAHDPEKVIEFPCFNYDGEALPMQGFSDVDSDLIEIGLDITPLVNYFPENGQAKIFLDIIQKSTDASGAGQVASFSVMDYTSGTHEFANTNGSVTIQANTITRLSVPVSITVNRPVILNEELPEADVNVAYRAQLEADGTTGPYYYSNPANWFVEKEIEASTDFSSGTKVFTESGITSRVMDLPFTFPFYGKSYNQITVMTDGAIVMGQNLVTYPYVIFPSFRFYQNPGIYPFFSTLYYTKSDKQVTMESDADRAIVRWKATVDAGGNDPVEFAAIIKPDGSIRFYYGTMDISSTISWISGTSNGDNLEYHLMDNYYSGISDHTAFSLELLEWPSWLSLGSNGDLKGTPVRSGSYLLPLHVTDWNGITNDKSLIIKVNGGSGVPVNAVATGAHIWPNPVSDDLWIEANSAQNGALNLTVYDLTGRQVLLKEFRAQAGSNTFHCTEIDYLTNGIYLYKMSGVLTIQGKLVKKD